MRQVKGGGEREEKTPYFFLPSPSPLSFFHLRTYRKGYYFYSSQSSTVIKSKMAATTITSTNKVLLTENTPALQANSDIDCGTLGAPVYIVL